MLTSCCSDIRVLSLLFFSGSVPPSFHAATLCLAQQPSSLYDGQCGLPKIFQLLMNMDEQLQPIIGCYVTDLTRSSVCTLSQLIKNQAKGSAEEKFPATEV